MLIDINRQYYTLTANQKAPLVHLRYEPEVTARKTKKRNNIIVIIFKTNQALSGDGVRRSENHEHEVMIEPVPSDHDEEIENEEKDEDDVEQSSEEENEEQNDEENEEQVKS
jgi:hypothetical protein